MEAASHAQPSSSRSSVKLSERGGEAASCYHIIMSINASKEIKARETNSYMWSRVISPNVAIPRGSGKRGKRKQQMKKEDLSLHQHNIRDKVSSSRTCISSPTMSSYPSFIQEFGNLMNGSGDAAKAGLARIVIPAQTEIVHPPDLWLVSDSDVDVDGFEVLEAIVEGNRCESAVCESRAGGNGNGLGGDCSGVAGALIKTETSEAEDARRTARITAKRCTIHIEAEAAREAVVAIANVTGVTIFSGVGTGHGVSAIGIEVGNELCE
jgi:hypothetical protein